MILAIDIGNTRTKLGVFKKDEIIWSKTLDEIGLPALKTVMSDWKIEQIAVASVSEREDALNNFLRSYPACLYLDENTPLPFVNEYLTPHTLGKDRLAAAAGAHASFPGKHCLVIDAGTCITADFITAEGHYLGGNISPGIEMRLKAMNAFTDRLPLVQAGPTEGLLGKSTEDALRKGGQLGAIMETEHIYLSLKEQFGKITPLITGGDTDFFVRYWKTKIFVNHYLVLFGLVKILEHNVLKAY